jgi:hypothetical protein
MGLLVLLHLSLHQYSVWHRPLSLLKKMAVAKKIVILIGVFSIHVLKQNAGLGYLISKLPVHSSYFHYLVP